MSLAHPLPQSKYGPRGWRERARSDPSLPALLARVLALALAETEQDIAIADRLQPLVALMSSRDRAVPESLPARLKRRKRLLRTRLKKMRQLLGGSQQAAAAGQQSRGGAPPPTPPPKPTLPPHPLTSKEDAGLPDAIQHGQQGAAPAQAAGPAMGGRKSEGPQQRPPGESHLPQQPSPKRTRH